MARRPLSSTADVVAAAARVIEHHGVDGLRITAVAAELGLSVGTVYNYVTGKDDLLAAVTAQVEGAFVAAMDAAAPPDVPLPEAAPAVADAVLRVATGSALVARLLRSSAGPAPDEGSGIRAWIATRVAVAVDAGQTPARDPALVAEIAYAAVRAALLGIAGGADPEQARQLVAATLTALTR